MKVNIYKLIDPTDNLPRYVGRTRKQLKTRLTEHISECSSNHNTYKRNWIKSLITQGLKPTIELIKVVNCTWEESHTEETSIIKDYFGQGYKLVNLKDKGCGGYGIKLTNISSRKPILQYDLDGNFVKEWSFISEAAIFYNVKLKGISRCLCDTKHKAYGFIWKYKTNNYPRKIVALKDIMKYGKRKAILQYDLKGKFIRIYSSATTAGEDLRLLQSDISTAIIRLGRCGNYQWRKLTKDYPPEITAYTTINIKVRCWNSEQSYEFATLADAARFIGRSYPCIRGWCKEKKFKQGYNWEFN